MQDNEKKPQCWNCENFSRYYEKGHLKDFTVFDIDEAIEDLIFIIENFENVYK